MPLPPVVIELGVADAASPHASEMIRACTEAVADGVCRVGASDEAGARAVVIVSWDEGQRHARIELGVRRRGANRWVSRRVSFKESDPEPERWRAVGLVVGTLVGEAEQEPVKPEPPSPPLAAPPAASAPPVVPPPAAPPAGAPPPPRAWLGVDVVAGPALDDGTWRLGALVSALYDVPGMPVFGSAAARYLVRPADEREVDVSWAGVSLGVGLHHEPTPALRLEGRSEATLERITASVGGPRRDSAGRWYPGMRLSLGFGPRLGEWGLLLASGELVGISEGTVIELEDQRVGRAPTLTWALLVGARLRLF
jgi:hypothetical protein